MYFTQKNNYVMFVTFTSVNSEPLPSVVFFVLRQLPTTKTVFPRNKIRNEIFFCKKNDGSKKKFTSYW